jgi:Nif-specific regulatory protein
MTRPLVSDRDSDLDLSAAHPAAGSAAHPAAGSAAHPAAGSAAHPAAGSAAPEERAPTDTTDSRLEILQEISLALNSTLDPGKLLEVILDSSIRYTGATTGSVILITDDGRLDIVASRGLGSNVQETCTLRVGEGVTGWVAQHGKPLLVPDVRKDPRYVMVKEHIRSELAVPMILENRVIGVISVDSTHTGNFSLEDEQLLSIVGTQAAQILHNAESYAELRRRNAQDETLLEIGQALGSSLDFEELFEQVSEILARRCQLTHAFLVLVGQDGDELNIVLAHGLTREEMARGRYAKGEGIVGRVVESGEAIGVRDIREEPLFLDRTKALKVGPEQRCFIAVPITLENEVVGVFGGAKAFPGEEQFEQDQSLLKIVAGTLAQAVKIYRSHLEDRNVLLEENRLLRAELRTRHHFDHIVGNSAAIQRVFQTVVSVAPTRATVLIRGESGTGKELIAQAIHFNSPRADGPFVRVNCAAIPEQLLEAELFGHRKGSFTGAITDRKGKFVIADGGTIFLDEIGDMSPFLQAKMLRVLQEKEVDAVGSDEPVKVDVRVIAATNRDLEALVREGKFREDLYYRLNVVPIDVPPLRERPEDIPVLAQHFLEKLAKENDSLPAKISKEALRELVQYGWPGNVRELENVIQRAAIQSAGKSIRPEDLPPLRPTVVPQAARAKEERLDVAVARHVERLFERSAGRVWGETIGIVERVLLEGALKRCDGVRLRAADLLGIHRNTLRKKADELGL